MSEFPQSLPQIHALFREPIPCWAGDQFVNIGADALAILEQFK